MNTKTGNRILSLMLVVVMTVCAILPEAAPATEDEVRGDRCEEAERYLLTVTARRTYEDRI